MPILLKYIFYMIVLFFATVGAIVILDWLYFTYLKEKLEQLYERCFPDVNDK